MLKKALFSVLGLILCLAPQLRAQLPPLPVTANRAAHFEASNVSYNADTTVDALSNGSSVYYWVDISGQGKHVSQATAAMQPVTKTNRYNGRPSVYFNGLTTDPTDARLTGGALSVREIFAVTSLENAAPSIATMISNGNDTLCVRRYSTTQAYVGNANSNSADFTNGGGFLNINGALTDAIPAYGGGHIFDAHAVTTKSYTSLWIGRNAPSTGGDRTWNGDIAEIIMYGVDLTADERTQVGLYLSYKYGIPTTYNDPAGPTVTLGNNLVASMTPQTIKAKATAGSGRSVARVEFFVNGKSVGVDTAPDGNGDYTASWTPATAGAQVVYAFAVDNLNAINQSQLVQLQITPLVFYIMPTAVGTGSGADWNNAITLAGAMTAAQTPDATDGQYPTDITFYMGPGTYTLAANMNAFTALYSAGMNVKVYGGFNPPAVADLATRNANSQWLLTPSIINGAATYSMFSFAPLYYTSFVLDGVNCVNARSANSGAAVSVLPTVSTGSVVLANCIFDADVATAATGGGAVYVNSALNQGLAITGCQFTNNSATAGRGGALVSASSCTIQNCLFTTNSAQGGGAIQGLGAASTMLIDQSNFYGNFGTNATHGGAILSESAGVVLTVKNSSFTKNSSNAGQWGGAIAFTSGRGTIFNCEFTTNVAGAGGAIWTNNTGTSVTIEQCQFTGNYETGSTHGGGAVYTNGGAMLYVNNSTFIANDATYGSYQGGAIYLSATPASIYNCTFTRNLAGSGGAIYGTGVSPISVLQSSFYGNRATQSGGGGGGAIYMNSTSTSFTVTDCSFTLNDAIQNGRYGGAIYVSPGNLALSNCTFTSNTGAAGGAICAQSNANVCTMTIDQCLFVGNKTNGLNKGGAIWEDNSKQTLLITNTDFIGNDSGALQGGALGFNNSNTQYTLWMATNCNFTSNSGLNGGAVYGQNSTSFTAINCSFTSNVATNTGSTGGGGAIFTETATSPYAKLQFSNCTFTGNKATGANTGTAGGAIFKYQGGVLTMDGCTLTANSSGNMGGAIASQSGTSYVRNTTFTNNMALGTGAAPNGAGGAYRNSADTCFLTGCTFVGNSGNSGGGAVSAENAASIATLDRCWIEGNTAFDGGGVYMNNNGSSVTILNSVIVRNAASDLGGGIYRGNTGPLKVINCTLVGNRANTLGAYVEYSDGIFSGSSNGGSPVTVLNTIFDDHDAAFLGVNDGLVRNVLSHCLFGLQGRALGMNNVVYGLASDSVYNSPQFNLATASDFTLASNSPAINTGIDTALGFNAPVVDFTGVTARPQGSGYDIGAYEFTGTPDTPPAPPTYPGGIVYVAPLGVGNGSSWTDAASLDLGVTTCPINGQIWMKAGDYPVSNVTTITKAMAIYGGFTGTPGQEGDFSQRNLDATPTTVTGSGSMRLVYITAVLTSVTIDGVNFTNGNLMTAGSGGAIYTDSALNLSRCNFTSNSVFNDGAGVYASNTSLNVNVSECVFAKNNASNGAGIKIDATTLTVASCAFSANSAQSASGSTNGGGAIFMTAGSIASVADSDFSFNTCKYWGGAIRMDGSTMTVANCSFNTNTTTTNGGGGAILDYNKSYLSVYNCTFLGNQSACASSQNGGGAIHVYNNSVADITSATFLYNTAPNTDAGALELLTGCTVSVTSCTFMYNTCKIWGGASRIENSTLTVVGCNFSSNTATTAGGGAGAILANNTSGYLSVYDTTFVGNQATASNGAGAVYVYNGAKADITSASFLSNRAPANEGGAMRIANSAVVTLTACAFNWNTCLNWGGAFRMDASSVTLNNCSFSSNSTLATGSGQGGGAILNYNASTLYANNCTFLGNSAASSTRGGGAISVFTTSKLFATNTDFLYNTTGDQGGALCVELNSILSADHCTFMNNKSSGAGGGGAIQTLQSGVVVTITDSMFANNSAPSGKGGAFRNSIGRCSVTDCSFLGNTSSYGGAVSVESNAAASQVLDRCWFEGNRATQDGGALYQNTDGTSITVINGVFVRNVGMNSGGAMRRENKGSFRMINCTFVDSLANASTSRGIYGDGFVLADGGGPAFFLNCLFDGHECAIYSNPGAAIPQVTNCLFSARGRNNGANSVIIGNLVNPVFGQAGDPLFNNPAGNDYTLANDSRAINAGIDSALGNDAPPVDYALNARPAAGTAVDIGAYESGQVNPNPPAAPLSIVRVTTDAAGGDGSSWSNPSTLDNALATVTTGGQIWMKTGEYPMANAYTIARPIGIYGGFAGVDGVDVSTASRGANYGADYARVNPTTFTASGADRVFVVTPLASQIALDGLNFFNGYALNTGGGAIQCYANISISQCVFTSNTARTSYFRNGGGALLVGYGVANIADTLFTGNSIHPASTAGGGGAILTSQSLLTMDRCVIDSNAGMNDGGGLFLDNMGATTLNDSAFTSNAVTVSNGGAIRVYGGVAVGLNSCVFSTNTVPGSGGAIHAENHSQLNAVQCAFYGNKAASGGAIRVITNTACNLTSCVLSGNSATGEGGAVYETNSGCAFNFVGSTFANNTAGTNGGAFRHGSSGGTNTMVTLTNSLFDGNTASTGIGGAFHAGYYGAASPVTGCVFNNNRAASDGGVARLWKDKWNFTNCVFTNNATLNPTAASGGAVYMATNAGDTTGNTSFNNCIFRNNSGYDGGAIWHGYVDTSTSRYNVTLNNCEFTGNIARSNGGAIRTANSVLTITSGTLNGNTATLDGGAISAMSAANVNIKADRCFMDGNSARNGGAIMLHDAFEVTTLTNCVITRNQASGQGGAIRRATTANLGVMNCTIAYNTAAGAQVSGHYTDGIYVGAGNDANTIVANSIFDGQDMAFGGTAATSITYNLFGPNERNGFANVVLNATPTNSVPDAPDPGFINAAAGNYDLVSVSPAINQGAYYIRNVSTTTVDILNQTRYLAPDLGAFEAAPGVTTITLADPNPAALNVKTFTYLVRFNQPVTGVDATDFLLIATGSIYGAAVTDVAALSTTDYIVTATIQGGAGTLRLDEFDDSSVSSPNTGVVLNHGNEINFIGQAYTVDYDASSVLVTAIALVDANPTSAGLLVYQVSFSQPVVNIDVTDFQATLGGAYTTRTVAPIVASVSAAAVSSSVLVTVDAGVSQGELRLDILGSSDIQDAMHSFAPVNIPYTAGPSYTFDNFAPVVLALAPRAPATSATSIIYDLTFNEPVTTVTADLLNLATDPQITTAVITDISEISSGERTSWTVTVGNIVAAGPAGGALHVDLISTNVLDNLGNALATTQTGAPVVVDQTAPSLVSIAAVGPNPTPATSVVFNVTFSEPVTGVTQSVFALSVIGGGGTSVISGVTGTGASYQVTVNPIVVTKQDGALLQLDLMNPAGIADQAGLALNAPATNGQVTVDPLAPGFDPLANVEPSSGSVVDQITVTTVTFNEPVSGVTTASLTLTTTSGTASPLSVVNAFGDGRTYVFTIDDNYGSGPVQIIMEIAGGLISDPTGNLFTGQQWSVIKDRNVIPVTLTSTQVNNGGLTSLTQIILNAHFSAPVTGFDPITEPGDLITSNCMVVAFSGANSDYLITVSPIAQGLVTAQIPTYAALSGTRRNGTSNLFSFTVDSIAPSFAGFAASPSRVKVGTTVTLTVTASEPLAAAATLTVNGHAASLAVAADPLYTFRYAPQALDVEGSATLQATGHDAAYNVGVTTNGIVLYVDKTAPTAVFSLSSPDAGALETITFSEEVTGVDVGDFVLTRNGVPVAELSAFTQIGPAQYTVVVGNTTPGLYELRLVAATSGIKDLALIPMAVDAIDTWQVAPAASAVKMWSRY